MAKDLNYFDHMISLNHISINNKIEESNIVFHYTKMQTFSVITNNQSIRFTDFRYLNDSEEFVWGIKQVKKILESINGDMAQLLLGNLDSLNQVELYVASFSLEPDLLSQWRAYGDNGKGVSFGVTPFEMRNALGYSLFYGKITYKDEEHMEIIKNIITSSIKYFNEKEMNEWYIDDIKRFLSLAIATFKHFSFFEEREYRFFVISNTKQRPSFIEERLNSSIKDGICKPYINMNTYELIRNPDIKELLPIKKVYIGPSNDFYASEIYINKLFEANKYEFDSSNIIKSVIPYRC